MEQPTFADLVYDAKKRQTRREGLLSILFGAARTTAPDWAIPPCLWVLQAQVPTPRSRRHWHAHYIRY